MLFKVCLCAEWNLKLCRISACFFVGTFNFFCYLSENPVAYSCTLKRPTWWCGCSNLNSSLLYVFCWEQWCKRPWTQSLLSFSEQLDEAQHNLLGHIPHLKRSPPDILFICPSQLPFFPESSTILKICGLHLMPNEPENVTNVFSHVYKFYKSSFIPNTCY